MNWATMSVLAVLLAQSGADYLGRLCGTAWGQSHYYPSNGSPIRKCIEHCMGGSFSIAGMIFGNECFCGNDFGGFAVCRPGNTTPACTTAECTRAGFPCRFDPTMICGGDSWFSVYDSSPQLHDVIYHSDTLVNQVCSENDAVCNFTCAIKSGSGASGAGMIGGSRTYDMNSSYCLSAAHDLRYVQNVNTSVAVKRQSGTTLNLEGSWRFGIQSDWRIGSTHQFTIASPDQPLFNFGQAVLYGFVNQGSRSLNCIKFDINSNSDVVFASYLNGTVLESSKNIHVPNSSQLYCGLKQSNVQLPATYVPIVTQPPSNEDVTPNRTVTVKQEDTLSFSFETSGLSGSPWSVEKAGQIIINATQASDIKITRAKASIEMTGFYNLRYNNGQIAATVRVIVVEKDRDLSVCGGSRGIPREDGTCLCLPPFGNASDCSGVCKPDVLDGTFGPNCDMNCGAKQCQGVLICGEDPFGCQCASGWTGGGCSKACPEGTYGSNCQGLSIECKCGDGSGCDRITGLCKSGSGCKGGWIGLDCKTQDSKQID